jgi:hypothetical protein
MPTEDNDPTQNPPGLSEEDVGKIVNAAVTSQLNRALPKALEAAGLKLPELIQAQLAAIKPPESPDDPAKPGKPGTKSDLEKTVQELAKKLEDAEKATKEAERQRIEAEQARRHDAAVTAFRSALQPKIRQELLDVAVSHWGSTEKRLTLSEDGSPLLRVKRAPYKGAPCLSPRRSRFCSRARRLSRSSRRPLRRRETAAHQDM